MKNSRVARFHPVNKKFRLFKNSTFSVNVIWELIISTTLPRDINKMIPDASVT